MDTFRPQKSPSSDRFLGLLSSSPPSAANAAFELDEQDIFSTDTNPNPNPSPSSIPISIPIPQRSSLNPNPSRSPLSPFHRERNFGILAALPEDSKPPNPKFLHRKPSISLVSSPESTSPSSSARMIPVMPKPTAMEYGVKIGQHQHQSAPVNVPVLPARLRKGLVERDESEDEDEMMMPPHEIVDRAQGKEEPLTTFSVLEGVGRTLKGRDLRRVRNAVWHKTGFLD